MLLQQEGQFWQNDRIQRNPNAKKNITRHTCIVSQRGVSVSKSESGRKMRQGAAMTKGEQERGRKPPSKTPTR